MEAHAPLVSQLHIVMTRNVHKILVNSVLQNQTARSHNKLIDGNHAGVYENYISPSVILVKHTQVFLLTIISDKLVWTAVLVFVDWLAIHRQTDIDVWEAASGASGASRDSPRFGLKSNSVSNARKFFF